MNRAKWMLVPAVVTMSVALVAWPVYGQNAGKADKAKEIAKALEANKMTLTKAIEAAETHSKGHAIMARAALDGKNLTINVDCVVGDKVEHVTVDGKTGKVAEAAAPEHHEKKKDDNPPSTGGKKGS